jgi:hypothetical protein
MIEASRRIFGVELGSSEADEDEDGCREGVFIWTNIGEESLWGKERGSLWDRAIGLLVWRVSQSIQSSQRKRKRKKRNQNNNKGDQKKARERERGIHQS